MSPPLLEIGSLSVRYGAAAALREVDVVVQPGEIVALLGANGAGKSTVLKAVMGLVPVEAGAVRFSGAALAPYPVERRARMGLSYAPEGRRLFPGLTVRENLEVACRAGRAERERRIDEAFNLFPQLRLREAVRAWQLSGGQSQMLAIARALMSKPSLLLLDEPSLGLSARLTADVMERLERVAGQGTSVLLAEQNANMALEIADRAYVLSAGRVALSGSAIELKGSEALENAFLGG